MVLYETDFYDWANQQGVALESGRFDILDMHNIIEEIFSLAKSEKFSLESYIERLIAHLLKEKFQPENNCKSWKRSILDSRIKIQRILRNSPSLKRFIPEIIKDEYPHAINWASQETELPIDHFPKECPWSIEEILNVKGDK